MSLIIKQPPFITKISCILVIGLASGCASINSGLDSGDLPPYGAFVADNGMQFNVQPLTATNLPSVDSISGAYSSSQATYDSEGHASRSQVQDLLRTSKSVNYSISPGDVLDIKLLSYPEIMSNSYPNSNNPYASGYPVDQQGYIQFPLIGRIKASGLSVSQFTTNLRTRLQRYLKYPDPQVKILNYRGNKFFIDGEVKNPGEFSIADTPVSLYSAISLAGGANPSGDANNIELIRQGVRYKLGLRDLQKMGVSASQIYLKDGDSIHINNKDRNKVYVLGEFGNVEPLEIPDQGISLAQVIGEAKGLDSRTANAAKVYVVRDHGRAAYTDIYYVDLQQVTNLALANRFEMQSNDIVYVDPTGLTRWSRFISSILPSASTISILSGL